MTPDERLAVLAVAGVWDAAVARAAGFTPAQIRARRASEWQVLRGRSYAYAGVEPSPVMRAAAAVLAHGGVLMPASPPAEAADAGADDQLAGAVAAQRRRYLDRVARGVRVAAAGRTAARVWGVPLVDDDDPATDRHERPIDDLVNGTRRPKATTATCRRIGLRSGDVVLVHGVPVLSRLRTAVDLGVVLRPDALVAALDHLLHEELIDLDDLTAAVTGNRRGRDGTLALRAALRLVDAKAESPHESLTRLVLKPVLPGLESQVRVVDRRGRIVARLDLGDEALELGVESDGSAYHRGRAAADRRRDFRTGWTVERVSWFETRCEQDQLRTRILATADRIRSAAA
jgi:hypothetical protein